jgi:NAD(P)-dependent dehydrogenase (short-subunit alcohol dehydrogenase family)
MPERAALITGGSSGIGLLSGRRRVHGHSAKALVVNTASITNDGIQLTAVCPGFVDTAM